jgi:hypothetical protein
MGEKIEQLIAERTRLLKLGVQQGSVQANGAGYLLVWKSADGERVYKTIQRCEAAKYKARCERYRQVAKIDKALARIEAELAGALAAVGVAA